MSTVVMALLLAPLLAGGYAYGLYPLLLMAVRRPRASPAPEGEWPEVSITVPAFNEEATIGGALDRLLETDYPPDRRHILVVSDASTDRTDAIVEGYRERGVRLLRLPYRGGKTAAENAARHHLRGDIVVNTDASVRIPPDALKPLVAAFRDPTVGVASGRDVSVARSSQGNVGEAAYVDYDMWVRGLETAAGGIVGASGCFYATRLPLHMEIVPQALSRDFAAPLIAREHGYRSVSVPEARCFVPRTASVRREYRRKVRTMVRGLQTLFYKRRLLNPWRFGRFAWMLFSHKLARWLVPWALLMGAVGTLAAAMSLPALRGPVAALWAFVAVAAGIAWLTPATRLPRVWSVPAFLVWTTLAGLHAWILAARGDLNATWEPTRREAVDDALAPAAGSGARTR